jgi:fatty acid/phospholipid biosynthesis enzyme
MKQLLPLFVIMMALCGVGASKAETLERAHILALTSEPRLPNVSHLKAQSTLPYSDSEVRIIRIQDGCSIDEAIDRVLSRSGGALVSASRAGASVIVKVRVGADIMTYRVDLNTCSVSRM